MNVSEAAVAHEYEMIARPGCPGQVADQSLDIFINPGVVPALKKRPGVPLDIWRREKEDKICWCKGFGKSFRVDAHAHGVRPGFQDGDQAVRADALAGAVKGGGDGRGVMGEIVVDMDIIDDSPQLHPPLDVLEPAQCPDCFGGVDARVGGGGDGGQGVADVVMAAQRPFHLPDQFLVMKHLESAAVFTGGSGVPRRRRGEAEAC